MLNYSSISRNFVEAKEDYVFTAYINTKKIESRFPSKVEKRVKFCLKEKIWI